MSTEEATAVVVETNGAEATSVSASAPAAEPEPTTEPATEPEKPAEEPTPPSPVEETKAPSRRSTRISSKPAKEESVATTRPRRSSTRKRGVEEVGGAKGDGKGGEDGGGGDEGKVVKKAKPDSPDSPIGAGLALGDSLPSIKVKNEKEEEVDVGKLAEEKGVVLFLVPKADTPGCTTQACGFRDIYSDFTREGYDVYCVSADSPAAQKKWQDKKSLPYPLLSDPTRTLISALGAADKGNTKTKRSHFIFEKGGQLVGRRVPVKAGDSPKLALEFIKSHTASSATKTPGDDKTNGTDAGAHVNGNAEAEGEGENPKADADAEGVEGAEGVTKEGEGEGQGVAMEVDA